MPTINTKLATTKNEAQPKAVSRASRTQAHYFLSAANKTTEVTEADFNTSVSYSENNKITCKLKETVIGKGKVYAPHFFLDITDAAVPQPSLSNDEGTSLLHEGVKKKI